VNASYRSLKKKLAELTAKGKGGLYERGRAGLNHRKKAAAPGINHIKNARPEDVNRGFHSGRAGLLHARPARIKASEFPGKGTVFNAKY